MIFESKMNGKSKKFKLNMAPQKCCFAIQVTQLWEFLGNDKRHPIWLIFGYVFHGQKWAKILFLKNRAKSVHMNTVQYGATSDTYIANCTQFMTKRVNLISNAMHLTQSLQFIPNCITMRQMFLNLCSFLSLQWDNLRF